MGRRRMRHVLEGQSACVHVYDIRSDRMAEVAEMFDVARLIGPEAFVAAEPDALFICVPPSDHEFYIDWAIEHRISFMVEQPISHRLRNLDRILAGVEAAGIATHVSNNHRFSAEVEAFREIVASNRFGRVLTAIVERGEWLPDWHPHEPYTDYYPSQKAMGGGLDAICDLAWLRHLFGEVREAKSLFSRRSTLDIDTSDIVQILLDFETGPQVVLHTDMLQRAYAGEVKLVFEKGTVTHTAPDPFIRIYDVGTGAWESVPLHDNREVHGSMPGKTDFNFVEPMYERDTLFFLDRLARGDVRTDSLRDGITNLRIIHPLAGGIE